MEREKEKGKEAENGSWGDKQTVEREETERGRKEVRIGNDREGKGREEQERGREEKEKAVGF